MRIDYKSTALLFDEYFTTELKYDASGAVAHLERLDTLRSALMERGGFLVARTQLMELRAVLKACWDAQEITRSFMDRDIALLTRDELEQLARAGIAAQHTNAYRNRLIREIDSLLGESDRTPLSKTYEKG